MPPGHGESAMTSFSCGNVLLVADAERCAAASELVCLLCATPATINQHVADWSAA